MSTSTPGGHFFHIHTQSGQCWDININPLLEWSVKLPTLFEKLTGMTTSNIGTELFSQIRTIKTLADGDKRFLDTRVAGHNAGVVVVHEDVSFGSGNAEEGNCVAITILRQFEKQTHLGSYSCGYLSPNV